MSHLLQAVVGAAVGDALGVPYEGKERDTYVCENMHPLGWHEKPVGFWSDDTAMILAELDSLRERQGYDAEDVMMKFDRWLHEGAYTPDGKAYGWGRTTARAVSRHRSGTPADICGGGDILDNGAGALMRMLPYALLNSPDRLEIVDAAGSLTHSHQISIVICRLYSCYVDELLQGHKPAEALEALIENHIVEIPDYYLPKLQLMPHLSRVSVPNSGFVSDVFMASIWCLINSDNYVDAVLKAVNLGGDADTIGAVTGGLAGIIYGQDGDNGIPVCWSHALSRIDYIEELCTACDGMMR